jgi:protoporphyrin/coproporphyrin ferrochelatase
MPEQAFDALLFVSFGGPEGPDDVMPFLENVLRGRNVPRERMLEVAEHYQHFGGVSPINQQCRELIAALKAELQEHQVHLPVYWGNRNWHPFLPDTIREIKESGARRILAFVTSGFSCYSGCRQYRENIYSAVEEAGASDVSVGKIRVFYNHPDFIAVNARHVAAALQEARGDTDEAVHVAFTAHSIPSSMASTSDYEKQLLESCRLIAESLNLPADQWKLVYQSRSGRPQDPWLEPDICDHIQDLFDRGTRRLVISPVGFLSDHMEVLYDLDDEARQLCDKLGMHMSRAGTPGHDPQFVSMIRKLIQERLSTATPECIGQFGPNHDVCPVDCCPAPQRPPQAGPPIAARP